MVVIFFAFYQKILLVEVRRKCGVKTPKIRVTTMRNRVTREQSDGDKDDN